MIPNCFRLFSCRHFPGTFQIIFAVLGTQKSNNGILCVVLSIRKFFLVLFHCAYTFLAVSSVGIVKTSNEFNDKNIGARSQI
jgi:hypothetical protein